MPPPPAPAPVDAIPSQWRSFVDVPADHPFPLQNLPYGVFVRPDEPAARVGVAIGEQVLDLAVLDEAGVLDVAALRGLGVFTADRLNPLLALGPRVWAELRAALARLLRHDEPTLRDDATLRARALLPRDRVRMCLPVAVGDYTDFYSSRHHAANVGRIFRGDANALPPAYVHLPIAYHGRASSIVLTGTDVQRPWGQWRAADADAPVLEPSRAVDFELELGAIIGPGNPRGQPIPVSMALDHVFGFVLVNDWSARDIQRWEYVPLGPFAGKNFATSISAWVVPLAALAGASCAAPPQEPLPPPYLRPAGDAFDLALEVAVQSTRMSSPQVVCRSNTRHLYWTLAQQIAHHTVNGCNLRPGDLLASGTISGPEPDSAGSLLELTDDGRRPIALGDGEARGYLADGDEVTLRGWATVDGVRIGLGAVTGRVQPARPEPVC